MKTVCIRQPGYLPNIGFFQKLLACDEFVYLDDTGYGSERWDNRNKIRDDREFMFLTVPIVRKTKNVLNQILIANNDKVVPTKHARNLASAFQPSQLTVITIPDTNHHNITHHPLYKRHIVDFL